jgi:hypothetical protein
MLGGLQFSYSGFGSHKLISFVLSIQRKLYEDTIYLGTKNTIKMIFKRKKNKIIYTIAKPLERLKCLSKNHK